MVDMAAQSVEQHARFFDHLVELIPPRFYYADAEERVDLHSMKKAARLAAKQEFKAKHKQNKRAKLDPDAPTLQGAQVAAGDGSTEQGQQQHKKQQQGQAFNVNLGPSTLSREELKARLQRKIEVRGGVPDSGWGRGVLAARRACQHGPHALMLLLCDAGHPAATRGQGGQAGSGGAGQAVAAAAAQRRQAAAESTAEAEGAAGSGRHRAAGQHDRPQTVRRH